MSNQFVDLLRTRRFSPMFFTQFFGALNDNIYKQALILFVTFIFAQQNSAQANLFNNLAAALFILPFFIFSATAGQIADRYERSHLVRLIKIFEIIIAIIASIGFLTQNIYLLLFALFLLGTQSAFFGPIKYAILPEILKPKELMAGNALFQSGTSLAILFGMIFGGLIMAVQKAQQHTWWIIITIIAIAIIGYISSRSIEKQTLANPDLKINWNFFSTSVETIKFAKQQPIIFTTLLGNSWYWFYGATYITQIPNMTKTYLHADETVVSLLLTLFSVGIGVGSLLCKRFSGELVNLKMVPFGAVGLTVFAIYLAMALHLLPAYHAQELVNFSQFFHSGLAYYHIMLAVILLGISGGFYIVPLYAFMQEKSPSSHRARIVAANNILNSLFMVSSAIAAIVILAVLKLSMPVLFLITAVMSALVTFYILRRLKQIDPTAINGG